MWRNLSVSANIPIRRQFALYRVDGRMGEGILLQLIGAYFGFSGEF